jgi:hypothetical protein
MDKTPLSLRMDFTLRLGSNSMDPILTSSVRRGGGDVSGGFG